MIRKKLSKVSLTIALLVSVFLMPFLSAGKNKNDYNQTLKIFYCYIPILIFILLPFYSFILRRNSLSIKELRGGGGALAVTR